MNFVYSNCALQDAGWQGICGQCAFLELCFSELSLLHPHSPDIIVFSFWFLSIHMTGREKGWAWSQRTIWTVLKILLLGNPWLAGSRELPPSNSWHGIARPIPLLHCAFLSCPGRKKRQNSFEWRPWSVKFVICGIQVCFGVVPDCRGQASVTFQRSASIDPGFTAGVGFRMAW